MFLMIILADIVEIIAFQANEVFFNEKYFKGNAINPMASQNEKYFNTMNLTIRKTIKSFMNTSPIPFNIFFL